VCTSASNALMTLTFFKTVPLTVMSGNLVTVRAKIPTSTYVSEIVRHWNSLRRRTNCRMRRKWKSLRSKVSTAWCASDVCIADRIVDTSNQQPWRVVSVSHELSNTPVFDSTVYTANLSKPQNISNFHQIPIFPFQFHFQNFSILEVI